MERCKSIPYGALCFNFYWIAFNLWTFAERVRCARETLSPFYGYVSWNMFKGLRFLRFEKLSLSHSLSIFCSLFSSPDSICLCPNIEVTVRLLHRHTRSVSLSLLLLFRTFHFSHWRMPCKKNACEFRVSKKAGLFVEFCSALIFYLLSISFALDASTIRLYVPVFNNLFISI